MCCMYVRGMYSRVAYVPVLVHGHTYPSAEADPTFHLHPTLATFETWETSSNVPLYPRKQRKQQWTVPSTSCPSFPGCFQDDRWPLPSNFVAIGLTV